MAFNERNLALLNKILSKKLHLSFHFHPYSSNCCLNIDSKKYSNKFDFSGNIRINADPKELIFEIIDFDLWKISETVSFDEFFDFYQSFILALENYAEQLGFNRIIFNVDSYIDPELQVIIFPRKVNNTDLKALIQDSSYDSRKNELMKLSVLKLSGYGLKNSHEDEESELLKNAINNQIDSMHHLTILEKEKLRLNLMKKSSLHKDYHVKKYFKYIN
ncbi:hypothetical protein [Listeria seeligeri]|uniref:hypothetical protein n=1 Tax=Listeria seeligeri TaxID=1640 RepID=UPI00162777AC|nr:hypothetical protein [Listeria seeligeri]MBC1932358.1 hypothetical protein [Listeria seeligeri]MBF2543565.1 hypothetical protein [Listeria seeligeri]MBF2640174.1 hypothetical protein [Listeria seeligeri]